MRVKLKIPSKLLDQIRKDLLRPHKLICERVGFIACAAALSLKGEFTLYAANYISVDDEDYEDPGLEGVKIGRSAIRKALHFAYKNRCSIIHTHLHGHNGTPHFSITDDIENRRMVPDFFNVQPNLPHGAVVLSSDSLIGNCWTKDEMEPMVFSMITEVGHNLRKISYER